MKKLIVLVFAVAFAGTGWAAEEKKASGGAKSAAELEKEKAMAEPYANDFGPADIDDVVKGYPKQLPVTYKDSKTKKEMPIDTAEAYKLLKERCSQCHQSARPLNSQFAEPLGKDMAARTAAVAALKKEKPGMFKDKNVWQVEDNTWQRYVKRMMSKPGCKISPEEGQKIWGFLSYDSVERKIKQPEKWEAHRKGLLEKFKKEHAKRYEELYGAAAGKGSK